MRLTMLKSKIHRATVTDADLSYEGSISIDPKLCEMARLHQFEKVEIYNCNNGARFSTYVIYGGDGEICLNGAAARHVHRGDLVIIACYAEFEETEAPHHKPHLVFVDEKNQAKKLSSEYER
ncbi:MAG: aspartate 1-decarboxylase [Bdellovibrionales bacterium]|nr:aspartate 1-decarboxylase [Bdellovibrionales bacterium]